ncbi:dynamin-1 family protein [Striga asiatica]|uniref:Dynamin-1 family protein n=1 Tax=Striga asiatica TaxID=4170 RepID=A0A5A7PZ46_STRAF|nr:dynamin-1 family protein [Striga asiatica]
MPIYRHKFLLLQKRPRTIEIFHIDPIPIILHAPIIIPANTNRSEDQHQLILQVPLQQPHLVSSAVPSALFRLPPSLPPREAPDLGGAHEWARGEDQRDEERAAEEQDQVSPPAAVEPGREHPGGGGEGGA